MNLLIKDHAMKTYRGSGGIAPRIQLHALAALIPAKEPPVPLGYETHRKMLHQFSFYRNVDFYSV
jgi:hypothetical protein